MCIPAAPAASRDVSSIARRGDTSHIYALILLLRAVLGSWVPKLARGGAGKSESPSWCLESDFHPICAAASLLLSWRWTCRVRGSSLGITRHPRGSSGCVVEGFCSPSCESQFPRGDGKAGSSLWEILTQFSCQRARRQRVSGAPLPSSAGAGRRPGRLREFVPGRASPLPAWLRFWEDGAALRRKATQNTTARLLKLGSSW